MLYTQVHPLPRDAARLRESSQPATALVINDRIGRNEHAPKFPYDAAVSVRHVLAIALYLLAAVSLGLSVAAIAFRRAPGLPPGAPPRSYVVSAGGGLLFAVGLGLEGSAELSHDSYIGLAGPLLVLGAIAVTYASTRSFR
jgi:hypothetical protein